MIGNISSGGRQGATVVAAQHVSDRAYTRAQALQHLPDRVGDTSAPFDLQPDTFASLLPGGDRQRAHPHVHYSGSLTTPTPDCLQGVDWFVLTQVRKLRCLRGNHLSIWAMPPSQSMQTQAPSGLAPMQRMVTWPCLRSSCAAHTPLSWRMLSWPLGGDKL